MAETASTIDLNTEFSWKPGTGAGSRVLQIEEYYIDNDNDGFADEAWSHEYSSRPIMRRTVYIRWADILAYTAIDQAWPADNSLYPGYKPVFTHHPYDPEMATVRASLYDGPPGPNGVRVAISRFKHYEDIGAYASEDPGGDWSHADGAILIGISRAYVQLMCRQNNVPLVSVSDEVLGNDHIFVPIYVFDSDASSGTTTDKVLGVDRDLGMYTLRFDNITTLNTLGVNPDVEAESWIPQIFVVPPNPNVIEVVEPGTGEGVVYTDPGATAFGSDGFTDITPHVAVSGDIVNLSIEDSYDIHYNVTDPVTGVDAIQETRIVNITPEPELLELKVSYFGDTDHSIVIELLSLPADIYGLQFSHSIADVITIPADDVSYDGAEPGAGDPLVLYLDTRMMGANTYVAFSLAAEFIPEEALDHIGNDLMRIDSSTKIYIEDIYGWVAAGSGGTPFTVAITSEIDSRNDEASAGDGFDTPGEYESDPSSEISGDAYAYDADPTDGVETHGYTVESRPDELDDDLTITGISCTPTAPYKVNHKWTKHFDAVNKLVKDNPEILSAYGDPKNAKNVSRYLDDLIYAWAQESLRNTVFSTNNDLGQWLASAAELSDAGDGGARALIKMLSPAGGFRNFDDLYCGPPAYITINSVSNTSAVTGYPSVEVEFAHHIPAGAADGHDVTSTRHINWRLETVSAWAGDSVIGAVGEVSVGSGLLNDDGDTHTITIDLSSDNLGVHATGYNIDNLLQHRDAEGNLGKYVIKAALMHADGILWEEGSGLTDIAVSDLIDIGDPVESMAVYPLDPQLAAPTVVSNIVDFSAKAQYTWNGALTDSGIPERLKVDVTDSVIWDILPGVEGDDATANATIGPDGNVQILDIGGDGIVTVQAAWDGRDNSYSNTSSTTTKIRAITIFGDGWDEGPDLIDFATDLVDDLSPVPYDFTIRTTYDTGTYHMTEADFTWSVSAALEDGSPVTVELSPTVEAGGTQFSFTIPISLGAGTGQDVTLTVEASHDSGADVAEGNDPATTVDQYQIVVTPVPVAGTLDLSLVEVIPSQLYADYADGYDEDNDGIQLPDNRLIDNYVGWALDPIVLHSDNIIDLIERGGGSIGEGTTLSGNQPADLSLIRWATHFADISLNFVETSLYGGIPTTNISCWNALSNNAASPWAVFNDPAAGHTVPESYNICVCDYYRFKSLVGFGPDDRPKYIEVGGLQKTPIGGYEHGTELYIHSAVSPAGEELASDDIRLDGLDVNNVPMIEIHSSDNGELDLAYTDLYTSDATAFQVDEDGPVDWIYYKFTDDALGWRFRLAAKISDHDNPDAPQNSFPVVSANTSWGGTADDDLAIQVYVDPCTNEILEWVHHDDDWVLEVMYDGTWHGNSYGEGWWDPIPELIQPLIYSTRIGSIMHDAGYTVESGDEGQGEYDGSNTICIRCPDSWKFLELHRQINIDPCNTSETGFPSIVYEILLDPVTSVQDLGTESYGSYEHVPFIHFKSEGGQYYIEPPPAPCDPMMGDCGDPIYHNFDYLPTRQAIIMNKDPGVDIAQVDAENESWDIWIEEHASTDDPNNKLGIKIVAANTPGVYYVRAKINGWAGMDSQDEAYTSWAAYRYVDCPVELKLPGVYKEECVEYLDSIDSATTLEFRVGDPAAGSGVTAPKIVWSSGLETIVDHSVHPSFYSDQTITWWKVAPDGSYTALPAYDGMPTPIIEFSADDVEWDAESNYVVEARLDTAGNITDPLDFFVSDAAFSTFMQGRQFRAAETGVTNVLCPEGLTTYVSSQSQVAFTRPKDNCTDCFGVLALDPATGCCPDEIATAITEGCGCDDTGLVIYSTPDATLADGTPISGDGCCLPLAIDDCGECKDPADPAEWNNGCKACLDPSAANYIGAPAHAQYNVDCAGVVGGSDNSCCEYACTEDDDCPPEFPCCRELGFTMMCDVCPEDIDYTNCLVNWLNFLEADVLGTWAAAVPDLAATTVAIGAEYTDGAGMNYPAVREGVLAGDIAWADLNALLRTQCESTPDCTWVNTGYDTTLFGGCGCICGGGGGDGGGGSTVTPGTTPGASFESGGSFGFGGFDTSDKDLKIIHAEIPVAEQTVGYHLLGLKAYTYEWNPIAELLYGLEGHVPEGVLAEDIEAVFPDLGKPDGDPEDGDLWWHDYPIEPEDGWGEFSGQVDTYYNKVNFELLHQMVEAAKK